MPRYTVHTQFIFKGTFEVEAVDPYSAQQAVEKNCDLDLRILPNDIYSTMPRSLINWKFRNPAEKKIGKTRRIYTSKRKQ